MKIVRRGALPVGGDSGLLDVRDRALAASAVLQGQSPDVAERGTVTRGGHLAGVRRARAVVRRRRGDPSRSASSSTRRTAWPAPCCRRCSSGCRSTPSRATSSPTGASRTTSRTRCCPRTASSSCAKTLEEGADFGVAFDGDADRCFFVDDTGEFVPGDFATALFAETRAREGARREGDLRRPRELGRAGDDRARRRHAARQPRRPRVHQAPHAQGGRGFAGEVSGHYYFRDFFQADSGVVPFLLMLELVSRAPARRSPRSSAPTASATSSPARSTPRSPTCPSSSRS